MATQIIALAILVFTAAIGIWKFVARLKSERRKLADEARKQYEEAIKSGDTSAISAALARINRLR